MAAVAAALLVTASALLLRKTNPELALALGIAGTGLLFFAALPAMAETVDFFRDILPQGRAGEVFSPLLKVAGIALISRMGAELCRDSGEGAMAMKLELLGAVLGFGAAMPVFRLLAGMLAGLGG